MNELISFLIYLPLPLFFIWHVRETHKEQKELVKAILAKDLTEYTQSTVIEEQSKKPVQKKEEEAISIEDLSEHSFDELIAKQLEQDAKRTSK